MKDSSYEVEAKFRMLSILGSRNEYFWYYGNIAERHLFCKATFLLSKFSDLA
jgi:hypothetical protein